MSKFEVTADNKGSFGVVAVGGFLTRPEYGKPVVLVKAHRDDLEDNERGFKLATAIAGFLNNHPNVEELLADEMIPVNFGQV